MNWFLRLFHKKKSPAPVGPMSQLPDYIHTADDAAHFLGLRRCIGRAEWQKMAKDNELFLRRFAPKEVT